MWFTSPAGRCASTRSSSLRGITRARAARSAWLRNRSAGLISSAVAVEAIFDWPGIGSYAVTAILTSDYKAILAVTLVVGMIYAIVNIIVDITHALLDPRVAESL